MSSRYGDRIFGGKELNEFDLTDGGSGTSADDDTGYHGYQGMGWFMLKVKH